MKRFLPGAAAVCALILAGVVAGGALLRKELPYEFEIVPIKNGIGITNKTAWNQRDLVVSWGEMGKESHADKLRDKLMEGSVNQLIVEAPASDAPYTVRIRRADLAGRVRFKSFETELVVRAAAPKYAVLVGASVGRHWDLPAFPGRAGNDEYVFGYRGKYGYDKGEHIERLAKAALKPDIVIIKECAAYFPEDAEKIIEKLPEWVDLLRESGITPALATCAPVTKENDENNPGRQEALNKANEFIRTYCAENNIALVDLAETLRVSEADAHLKEDFAQADGLHLTPAGYEELDAILIPSLTTINDE